MLFSLLAGFLFSGLIGNNFSNNPAVEAEILFSSQNNSALAFIKSINHLPENSYKYFYFENFLPPNKNLSPRRKENILPADFFLEASSSVAIDVLTGDILYSADSGAIRPIASLSKLAAALTFLDMMPEWNNFYEIKKSDLRSGGKSHIYKGDEVKIIDLFHLSLIASDNSATVALGSALGLSEPEFVAKMNKKAALLGLKNTHFEDTTGLSRNNVSTAEEVAILARKSFARKNISNIVLKQDYSFLTRAGREIEISSTDNLLSDMSGADFDILGGKTGYTLEAGYCFAGEFFRNNRKIISVVLGTPTEISRFEEAKKLASWVFSSFLWE